MGFDHADVQRHLIEQARFVGGPGDGQTVPVPVARIIDTATGILKREIWPPAGVFDFGGVWCRYEYESDGIYRYAGKVEEA